MPQLRMSSAMAIAMLVGCSNTSDNAAVLQGTVEVREVDVAPMLTGRVTGVLVDEGHEVRVGDTIAILTAPTLAADLDAAAARVAVAEATLADLQSGARVQELDIARAALAAARTDSVRLARDADRLKALLDAGAVAPRDYEAAAAAADVAAARVRSAVESLRLLEAGARSSRIAAARAEVAAARATLASREASSAEFVLTAPIDGMVLSRLADPGDLLAAGVPVVVIGVISEPWVRVYVPARVLPMVMIGDTVAIYPPGAGGAVDQEDSSATVPRALTVAGSGRIVAINPQAEYVTRVALTPEERADLLFGVRVAIDPPSDRFKPGLPVTVRLDLRGTTP